MSSITANMSTALSMANNILQATSTKANKVCDQVQNYLNSKFPMIPNGLVRECMRNSLISMTASVILSGGALGVIIPIAAFTCLATTINAFSSKKFLEIASQNKYPLTTKRFKTIQILSTSFALSVVGIAMNVFWKPTPIIPLMICSLGLNLLTESFLNNTKPALKFS